MIEVRTIEEHYEDSAYWNWRQIMALRQNWSDKLDEIRDRDEFMIHRFIDEVL